MRGACHQVPSGAGGGAVRSAGTMLPGWCRSRCSCLLGLALLLVACVVGHVLAVQQPGMLWAEKPAVPLRSAALRVGPHALLRCAIQASAGLGGFSERGNFLLPSAQSATRSPLAAAWSSTHVSLPAQ